MKSLCSARQLCTQNPLLTVIEWILTFLHGSACLSSPWLHLYARIYTWVELRFQYPIVLQSYRRCIGGEGALVSKEEEEISNWCQKIRKKSRKWESLATENKYYASWHWRRKLEFRKKMLTLRKMFNKLALAPKKEARVLKEDVTMEENVERAMQTGRSSTWLYSKKPLEYELYCMCDPTSTS